MKPKRKLLSHASLRRPFVVTVSAVASIASSACGGATTSGEMAIDPASAGCPAARPASGDACNIDPSRKCGYGDCDGTPTVRATCEPDGKWTVGEMSCNPPRPSPVCPTTQPTPGDACNLDSSKECGYGDCYGTPTITATCGPDGTWSVGEMSCNPPPPVCPTTQPTPGEACNLDSSETCGYGDCYGTPTITATCGADGTWSVGEISCNPPPPICPTSQPTPGEACNLDSSKTCGYGDCYGTPTTKATCGSDGKWSVAVMSCNPPPPSNQ